MGWLEVQDAWVPGHTGLTLAVASRGRTEGSGRWLRQQWGGPSLIPEGALGCSRLPFLGLAASLLPGTGSWLFLP